jgi:hypothetical protein
MKHSGLIAIAGAALLLAAVPSSAPRSNSEMNRIDPVATLQPDAFDTPAPAAVAEAEKAAGGGAHDSHGDHGSHGTASSSAEVLYVCPMHPEVTSHEPGTCPKCGMTLVKKEQ